MLFAVKSPTTTGIPDEQLREAYFLYRSLVERPQSPEQITAAGGWPLKLVQALRNGILPPEERFSRILDFLESEADGTAYEVGVINGLRLAVGILDADKTTQLCEIPKAAKAKESPTAPKKGAKRARK